ncbi:MAG TPA: FUSC family protein [Verrucomicrobiae bacterium]|jgi:uncharacterized membrane protein YccC|nr:FUSC family protein [Verrucomicrobiae bacterium]
MRPWIHQIVERFELQPDAARSLRAGLAFAIPLLVCHQLHRAAEATFISMAALNLSLPDLRGAYRIRFSILAAMTLLAASSAFLGVCCAGSPVAAVMAMGFIALLGGVWRHLSGDYGPSMAVSSALLFLLGLAQPGGEASGEYLALQVATGGALAAFFHVCYWFVRPQHALRFAVAETWVAASDLAAAMRPGGPPVAMPERELRAALDRTFVVLGASQSRKQSKLIAHLEEIRREVVHLTTRMIAFHTSLEPVMARPDFARCVPVVDSVMKALGDAARSVALTLIMHRAENFAASNVRLRRCRDLICTLEAQINSLANTGLEMEQVRATLARLAEELPRIRAALRETADHTVARSGFSASLPDLSARSVQSLGAWLRPSSQPDPVLIRYALRMAVFTMLAVALYKYFEIPRGYWIAFTIMVVLQPDYGSTRQRAGQRIGGTAAAAVIAGALIRIKLPLLMLDGLACLSALIFAYFLKRSYGLAIFFVTINLALITETLAPVKQDFIVVRVLATLLGGGLALLAARIFLPIWEGQKSPVLLAAALRANAAFLRALTAAPDPLMAKRAAENANRYLAASVERLLAEPAALQENPERLAALATYNQRITRALTVLAVQLPVPLDANLTGQIERVLESLAERVAASAAARADLGPELQRIESALVPTTLVNVQLLKIVAEIRAMAAT